MQIKIKIIVNSEYTDIVLHVERFLYSPNQWRALLPVSGASSSSGLYRQLGRLFEASGWESIKNRVLHVLEGDKEPSTLSGTSSSNILEQSEYFGNKFHSFYEFVHKVRARSSLLKIKRKINQLQRIINAPKELRPSYGAFNYVDSYFIELDTNGVMRLIETENGRIQEVRRTRDLDELLYWIFTNITFTMACKQETGNHPPSLDPRIGIFLQQEQLLGKLYPHWQDRMHAEYEAFIKKHPKDDTSVEDVSYCEALRKLIRSETVENASNYFRYS
jgi:hypothetical protein